MNALLYDPTSPSPLGDPLSRGSLRGLNDLLQDRLQALLDQGWSLADDGPNPPDTLQDDGLNYDLAFFLRFRRGGDYTFLALYLPSWLGLWGL